MHKEKAMMMTRRVTRFQYTPSFVLYPLPHPGAHQSPDIQGVMAAVALKLFLPLGE